MEQISTLCTYLPRGANYAHERNLLSHMYNLILDFNKLPIFSIRPCLKINYINRPFIKLKIMVSVATASSDMPGCKAEQLEFLVHGLRFARFFFRIISLLHLSNRKQSLPNPGAEHESRPPDVHIDEKVPLHDNGVPSFTIRLINVMFRWSNN